MTRSRICVWLLAFAPLLIYWPTVFHDYGLRDDYSVLREAREEPGKVASFTASQGRPLYGAGLETSFRLGGDVSNLRWVRLLNVALLTVLALGLFQQLRRFGWHDFEAGVVALGVACLPAAQVIVSWAICWPHFLALLLSLAGFIAVETELDRGGLRRFVALLGGALIYLLAGIIYQSNAMFALVPIAGVLLVRPERENLNTGRWLAVHLGTLFFGLLGSFLLVKFMFSTGVAMPSPRFQFEHNPVFKLAWFLYQPVPNAAALFVLRDDFGTGAVWLWSAAAGAVGVIAIAGRFITDRAVKIRWLICVGLMPFAAHAVSLLAEERSVGYRVLFALSGLVLVLFVFTLRLLRESGRLPRLAQYSLLAVLVLAGAFAARRNAFDLLAEPQSREWEIVRRAVQRQPFKGPTKVYLVTPTQADRSTTRVFTDEFGSLTSNSDWAPREMFKAALHERFGAQLPKGAKIEITLGESVPPVGAFDLVVDFRQLKALRAP